MPIVIKEDIETVVDRLEDYVRINRKVGAKEAASALGITPQQVEKLALLLEESGLIEVKYALTGVVLTDKSQAAKDEEMKEQGAKDALKAAKTVERANAMGMEVAASEGIIRFFEKDMQRRVADAEKLLEQLETAEEYSPSELAEVKRAVSSATEQLKAFSLELDRIHQNETRFYDRLYAFKQKIEGLEKRFSQASKPVRPVSFSPARQPAAQPANAAKLEPALSLPRLELPKLFSAPSPAPPAMPSALPRQSQATQQPGEADKTRQSPAALPRIRRK